MASEKRWGETGPAGDSHGLSPLLSQLESLEMLWVEKDSSLVGGQWESPEQLRLKVQCWSLLQEPSGPFWVPLDVCKDKCNTGMSQAALPSRLEMKLSWDSPSRSVLAGSSTFPPHDT